MVGTDTLALERLSVSSSAGGAPRRQCRAYLGEFLQVRAISGEKTQTAAIA